MPVIVYISRCCRRENENKHDDHESGAKDVAFKHGADNIETLPVDDNITDNEANRAIQSSGSAYFYIFRLDKNRKYISANT
jgi:hypothetical protein